MVRVFESVTRSCLLCCTLFAILFTPTACSQSVGTTSELLTPSLASLRQAGETQCLQPPASMNFQISTDQQLASWGLPTHKAIDNDPTLAKNLTHLKHRVCGSDPNMHLATPDTIQNSIWGGYIARGNRGVYTEANMYFTIPTLTAIQGINNQWIDQWVGVGDGDTSPTELVQVGVASGISIDSSGSISISNIPWGYVIGDGLTKGEPMTLQVNPSDKMWAYVGSNADGDRYDSFLLKDLTQGTYQTVYEYASNALSDSSSAECIVEDPSGGVAAGNHLANFRTATITGCGAYVNGQGGMAPIGNFPNDQINMVYNGATLASTSSLRGGSDFDVTWQATGS